MQLSLEQIRVARYAIAEMVDRRALSGIRQEPRVLELLRALMLGGSASGTEMPCVTEESESCDEWITSAEASLILGCTDRYVRKIAPDLEGVKRGNTWTYPRSIVEDYAEAKGVVDDRNRPTDGGRAAIPA